MSSCWRPLCEREMFVFIVMWSSSQSTHVDILCSLCCWCCSLCLWHNEFHILLLSFVWRVLIFFSEYFVALHCSWLEGGKGGFFWSTVLLSLRLPGAGVGGFSWASSPMLLDVHLLKRKTHFYAHSVFRLKPKEHCISKYKGYDLRGQTFFISLHIQKLNETNFLLDLFSSSVSFLR